MRSLVLAFLLSCGAAAAQSGYGKTIFFSGHEWIVKVASPAVGPGPNLFSDSANNVWVDSAGRLHLKITKSGNKWTCAEVVSRESFGHGVYRFYLDSEVDKLDRNVVLGLFTWNDDPAYAHRELDIEFARWGSANNPANAQYVVQPYDTPGNLMSFIQPPITQSTHSFDWRPTSAAFQSLRGHATANNGQNLIAMQTFVNGIPQAGGENARINLWLFQGRAPSNRKAVEVIVNRFEFVR